MKRVLGVIGYPISHSLSPVMHNAVIKRLKLNLELEYHAFEVKSEDLKEAVLGAKSLGFLGLNVTLPHKEKVLEFCDELSEEAKITGAVNTLLYKDNRIQGYNTDILGFEKSLEKYGLEGKSVAIIGAGGASKSCVVACLRNQAKRIVIFDIIYEKAKALSEKFGCELGNISEVNLPEYDIVINATPIGLKGENLFDSIGNPPPAEKKRILFFDLIYIPTPFVKIAKKYGHYTDNGVDMFVLQGAESFKIWTGICPDTDYMKRVVVKNLSRRN